MVDIEKHRRAGEILKEVRKEAIDLVGVGESMLEVAEFAEEKIYSLGGEPAFPVNISVDEEAAHVTPSLDDSSIFEESMVNLDIGVHVDGWIADSAVTVDLGGNEEMVEVAEKALDVAIDSIESGVSTADIGGVIEKTIKDGGFSPVYNLTGHGLGHYKQHTSPSIPNKAVDKGSILEEGMVVAIEPFVTDGRGKVNEGSKKEIYALKGNRNVRSRRGRNLIEEIEENYGDLPFAKRWVGENRLVDRLEGLDALRSYPVLKEKEGNFVAQAEHTVLVKENGCEIFTK